MYIFEPIKPVQPSAKSIADIEQTVVTSAAPERPLSRQEQRERLEAEMFRMIDRLPQRDALELSDIKQWVGYVANTMPDQAIWHVIRAGGIGGSEIGGLVRNYLGYRADFMFSAHDWALSKLFKRYPEGTTSDMLRGLENEASHAARFYREYSCHRDQISYERLKNAQGKALWMRYSPDDIVKFDDDISLAVPGGVAQFGKGSKLLLDYKSPSVVDDSAEVSFQYVAQLNMGAILCAEQGIELSGTLLSQFDWSGWRLKNDYVAVNPKLCELIREAGDHYWSCVLRKEVPGYIQSEILEFDPDGLDAWQETAQRLAELNALSTAMENESKELRKSLVNGLGLERLRLAGKKIVFPDTLTVSASTTVDSEKVIEALRDDQDALTRCLAKVPPSKQTYNAAAMAEKLKDLGVDLDPFVSKKFDPLQTYQVLVDKSLDADSFMQDQVRLTVNKKVSQQAKDWVAVHFERPTIPVDAEEASSNQNDSESAGDLLRTSPVN